MSGGHFNYDCHVISRFATDLKAEVENNDNWEMPPETISRLNVIVQLLESAGKLAHAAEWLYSDDYGPDSFNKVVDKIMGGVDE